MQTASSTDYVAEMSHMIDQALSQISLDADVALLDFPDIRNVGDSAIWLGEMAYFRRKNVRPSYVSIMRDYRPNDLTKYAPEGPIFLRGGGNFGDLWPGHQRFRERVLADFPDREVVQLPQSIHFNSDEAADRAAAAIAAHGRFKLFVRDRESQTFARERLHCEAILCPDMAFSIGPVDPIDEPSIPLLAMLRADKEASASVTGLPADIAAEDWIEEDPAPVAHARRVGKLRALASMNRAAIRLGGLEAMAQNRFNRGVRQLSRAQRIVTDRLHVHIVSLLLGKPHAVLDNNYGKIGRFRSAFPEPQGLTFSASSIGEALDWAHQFEAA